MGNLHTSVKGGFAAGKLVGAAVAASVMLFAAPAAIALADPVGDLGNALNSTANQVNSVVRGNVGGANGSGGLNGIVRGNLGGANGSGGLNGIVRGNAGGANGSGGLNGIVLGNVNGANGILRGLLGL